MKFDHAGHANCTRSVEPVSNLSACTQWTRESLAAMALKTTWDQACAEKLEGARRDKLKADRRAWDNDEASRAQVGKPARNRPSWYDKEKRNLRPDEKRLKESKVGARGLLHYLYRLRIKANYLDADMFVDGPASDFDARLFVRHLTYFGSAITIAHEQRVRHEVGAGAVREMRARWSAGTGGAFSGHGVMASYRDR